MTNNSGYCEENRLKLARMGGLFIEDNDGGLLRAFRENTEQCGRKGYFKSDKSAE